MKKLLALALPLFLALSLAGCGGPAEASDKPTVVATLFPQYDFARNIAGEDAEVSLLLDYGADAHSYDPTPADLIAIARADLFLYTGDDMERWAAKLLGGADIAAATARGALTVVDLSASVELLPSGDGDADEYDPHIWTSLSNAISMCETIRDALCEKDPAHTEGYTARCAAYIAELAELDKQYRAMASTAARKECYFGGSFAFAYLFDRCGLTYQSVYSGCSAHAEAASADVAGLIRALRESGATVLLYEDPADRKIAETVAAETGAKLLRLHAVHNISKAEADSGATYLSLMEQNLSVLSEALQ